MNLSRLALALIDLVWACLGLCGFAWFAWAIALAIPMLPGLACHWMLETRFVKLVSRGRLDTLEHINV